MIGCFLVALAYIHVHPFLTATLSACSNIAAPLCVFICRHRESQHSPAISPCTSITLLDVLHEVPVLPQLLTPGAQKALSAASRGFRERFVAQVQTVTVTCEEDAASVLQCRWPRLSMVIVQNVLFTTFTDTTIQAEVFSSAKSRHSVVFMLRPPHTSGLVWASLAAQQLAHQMTTKWPELSSFSLRYGSLPALRTAISLHSFPRATGHPWNTCVSPTVHSLPEIYRS